MGEILKLDDGFFYITSNDSDEIEGVQWFKRNQYVIFDNSGYVSAINKSDGSGIEKHELRQLMIMWLALNYPDCLAEDQLSKESKLREDTGVDEHMEE